MTPPDDIRKAREIEFLGFKITMSPHLPAGSMLWVQHGEVLGVVNLNGEREKLFNKFGLTAAAPEGTTGAVLAPEDYHAIAKVIRRSEP